jgi:site-specific DNA-methyltransferase (adenine-specific)
MIINNDSFEYLKSIESNSIDLILTDPPYLISKESNFKNYSDSTSHLMKTKYGKHEIDFGDWDKTPLDVNYLMKEFYRVLRKGGTLIIFFDIWKSSIIKESAEIVKFKQPRVGIWLKNNAVPINSKINYLSNAQEFFFSFVKDKNPTFNSKYDNGVYNFPLCHGKERLNHPTQKPLKLFEELIIKHSNEGDIVLDPFSGTGTTSEACINLNRKFICIEKDKNYYDISMKRLNLK